MWFFFFALLSASGCDCCQGSRRPATLFSAEPCNQIAVSDNLPSAISLPWNAGTLGAESPGFGAGTSGMQYEFLAEDRPMLLLPLLSQACLPIQPSHFLGGASLVQSQFPQIQIGQPDKSSVLQGLGGGNAESQLLFSVDLQESFRLTCDPSTWGRGPDSRDSLFLGDPHHWPHNGLGLCAKLFMFPQQNLLPSLAFCN